MMDQALYDATIRRGKTDEQIAGINLRCLTAALEALYDTHVVKEEAANARGLAIRTLQDLGNLLNLDGDRLVRTMEEIPISRRRRESRRWLMALTVKENSAHGSAR